MSLSLTEPNLQNEGLSESISHKPCLSSQSTIALNQLISPRALLSIAWGLTGIHSTNPVERIRAERLQQWWENLRDQTLKKNGVESRIGSYLINASASIAGNSRTVAVILTHRNYNFEKLERLKEAELKTFQQYGAFSANLQSISPRLATAAVGGFTIPTLLTNVFGFSTEFSTLLIAAAAGGIYLVSEIGFKWYGSKSITETEKRYENRKADYFNEAMRSSEVAFIGLLDDLLDAYREAFGTDEPEGYGDRQKVVRDVMGNPVQATYESVTRT